MEKYVDVEIIAEALHVTSETLRKWCLAGTFPQPIQLGERCRRWRESDLEDFLETKQTEAKENQNVKH